MLIGDKTAYAKGWFLTYPKCALDKEKLLDLLNQKYSIVEYVICKEKHKDNSEHLHAFIKLNQRVHFRSDMFDVDEYHGHYEPAKSWNAVKKYCQKGGDFITNLNLDAIKKHQSKFLFKEDWEKHPLELLESEKINFFQLVPFVRNQNLYRILRNNSNGQDDLCCTVEKKRHFWFYGKSNTGKTTKLRECMKNDKSKWFQIPTNNDWQGYNNEQYLYIDEFKAQINIQDLNRICDGGAKVNTKGATVQLHFNCIVYIVSNYSIKDCYYDVDSEILETLYNRFIQVKFPFVN